MKDPAEHRYFVEAAAKTLDVLESFDSPEEELTITEIARRAGMTYSSAFRLLFTLEKRGYVMRRTGARKYMRTPARKHFRIGYAALDNRLKFTDEVTRSLVLAARVCGVELVARDNEFSPSKALANLDSLLAERIHLLIEYQADETVAHMIADKCHKEKIPVIAINFAHPGAYYFGGDNYLAGRLAGEFLSEYAQANWQGSVGRLLILPAKGLGSTQQVRTTGVRDSVRERLSNAKIVVASPGITPRDGYRETKKLLEQGASQSGGILIAAMTDPLAIGCSRAVAKLNLTREVAILGLGGGPDGRKYLQRDGPFRATVGFFPGHYGERVMQLALKILAGEKLPLISYTQHIVLTRENLAQYYPPAA